MRVLPRKVEAAIGIPLIKLAKKKGVQDACLVQKAVDLPKSKIRIHYYERGSPDAPLTLLFLHGVSDESISLAPFIHSLQIPDQEVRILVPDAIGHGEDLKRAKKQPEHFQQPTPHSLLGSTIEFLEVLNVQNCNAFGYSLGGALAYFLRCKLPGIVKKTVLVSPSFESVMQEVFKNEFLSGQSKQFCFASRQDAKVFFREGSIPKNRTKRDPIPKFFLEAIWRDRQRSAPPNHFEEMLTGLLKFHEGEDSNFFGMTRDIDPDSPRLVFWPDEDYICTHDKGKELFGDSTQTEFVTLHGCGHLFFADGTFLLENIVPQVSKYLLSQT
jgi:pimeloyl-ACP methyl ester carboxylesterase